MDLFCKMYLVWFKQQLDSIYRPYHDFPTGMHVGMPLGEAMVKLHTLAFSLLCG